MGIFYKNVQAVKMLCSYPGKKRSTFLIKDICTKFTASWRKKKKVFPTDFLEYICK